MRAAKIAISGLASFMAVACAVNPVTDDVADTQIKADIKTSSAPKISLQDKSQAGLTNFRLTRVEAQTHACPQSVLEVGASEADCQCAEDTLFTLGQDEDVMKSLEGGTSQIYGDKALSDIKPRRITAIEILRLDAFEACGEGL